MAKINIIIAGEGGQGIQTIAKIFAKACFKSDKKVVYMPSFGVEQRGAPSIAYITISDEGLRCPRFSVADYAVILQNRAVSVMENYISPNTKVIFDSSTIDAKNLPKTAVHLMAIPATKIAAEKFTQKSFNLIMLGAFCELFELKNEVVWDAIVETLGKKFKTKQIETQNREAFLFGSNITFEQKEFTSATFKTKHRSILVKGYDKSGEINPSRCKGCGICIQKCPVGALSFGSDLGVVATPIPTVDLEKCIACGNCRNFCPDSAISINKDSLK